MVGTKASPRVIMVAVMADADKIKSPKIRGFFIVFERLPKRNRPFCVWPVSIGRDVSGENPNDVLKSFSFDFDFRPVIMNRSYNANNLWV